MDESSINDQGEDLNIKKVRSPRSAAVAGIVFSLLVTTSMLLLTSVTSINPEDINEAWLNETEQSVCLAIGFVPFAGITLLWFTCVIRDLLGHADKDYTS